MKRIISTFLTLFSVFSLLSPSGIANANAPVYSDTNLPLVTSLFLAKNYESGTQFPGINISFKITIETKVNPVKHIQIEFRNLDAPKKSPLVAPCQSDWGTPLYDVNYGAMSLKSSSLEGEVTRSVFQSNAHFEMTTGGTPFCAGKWQLTRLVVTDVADHFVEIGNSNYSYPISVFPSRITPFYQTSNVWSTTGNYPCKALGAGGEGIRSMCDSPIDFSSINIDLNEGVFSDAITYFQSAVKQAIADKAAADKAAADKAAADKAASDKLAADLAAKAASDKVAAELAASKAASAKKPLTISCVKGKVVKRVTGVAPKCPSGYTKKK